MCGERERERERDYFKIFLNKSKSSYILHSKKKKCTKISIVSFCVFCKRNKQKNENNKQPYKTNVNVLEILYCKDKI